LFPIIRRTKRCCRKNLNTSFLLDETSTGKIGFPDSLRERLQMEDDILNKIIDENGENYEGTCFMHEAKRLYKKEIKKKRAIAISDADVDPFLAFGHGIKSYFKMQEFMMITFAIITILVSPLLYYYHQGGAFENENW